jgi:hypothetical protein
MEKTHGLHYKDKPITAYSEVIGDRSIQNISAFFPQNTDFLVLHQTAALGFKS